jgi:type I restriction enzyme S subunit
LIADMLPSGWKLIRLGDLGKWHGGGTPSKSHPEFWNEGSIPWLSPKDMGQEVILRTRDHITGVALENSPVRLVPPDSVAIVTRSGILEHTVPIARVPFATTLNQDMKAIQVNGVASPKWVAWCLLSLEREILRRCRKDGTTVASLSTSALMDLKIPIAPLDEQLQIIDLLEDHLSRIDTAMKSLSTAALKTTRLRLSAITSALRGETTPLSLDEGTSQDLIPTSSSLLELPFSDQPWDIPEGWLWINLGRLFDVYVGSTPSRKVPDYWTGDVPWVSSGEVAFNRISSTREKINSKAVGNQSTRIHPPGTVMIAMIGEGKTRGQAAILDIEAAHNQNCASIRVSATRILPEFIYLVLEGRYQQTRKSSSGGNQPALNKAKVEAIPIPLPPLATQRQIVAQLEEFSQATDRFRSKLNRALKLGDRLRRSLLAHAFSGQLSARVPADKSAPHDNENHSLNDHPQLGNPSHAQIGPPSPAAHLRRVISAFQEELDL